MKDVLVLRHATVQPTINRASMMQMPVCAGTFIPVASMAMVAPMWCVAAVVRRILISTSSSGRLEGILLRLIFSTEESNEWA
jgi:hypothetical protein